MDTERIFLSSLINNNYVKPLKVAIFLQVKEMVKIDNFMWLNIIQRKICLKAVGTGRLFPPWFTVQISYSTSFCIFRDVTFWVQIYFPAHLLHLALMPSFLRMLRAHWHRESRVFKKLCGKVLPGLWEGAQHQPPLK